jgi:hypothetical protein
MPTLLRQAAAGSPPLVETVIDFLYEADLFAWTTLVDAVLRGVLARRSELAAVAANAWAALVIPYQQRQSPYWHDEKTAFLAECVAAAPATDVPEIATVLLRAIEAEGVPEMRLGMLESLGRAARARGVEIAGASAALTRWEPESPPEREDDTHDRARHARTLGELRDLLRNGALEAEHYGVSPAVERASAEAPYLEVKHFVHDHPAVLNDKRTLSHVGHRALDAGDATYARELLKLGMTRRHERSSWDSFIDGTKFRLHALAVRLGGEPSRRAAYAELTSDLAHGREWTGSLLAELDDALELIADRPDWAAAWAELADQLVLFREYEFSPPPPAPGTSPPSDEALIASLYKRAFMFPSEELRRHARIGSLKGVRSTGGAAVVTNSFSS